MIGNKPDFMERGTIVQADLGKPTRGSEQAGQRPAVIVSARAMTAGPTLVIIPCTTTQPGRPRRPYEVILAPEETGLPAESTALVHHIRVIDKRFILDRHRGRVTDSAMRRIDATIRLVLDVA
ncbi:MAG TPA: type II toxin-antitoxin system PemK/MazF family toxin [Candidatus Limnocylindrales bacterium]